MARLIKVVRDRVIEYGDFTVKYEPLVFEDGIRELRKKLVEESAEYILEPSVEELSDVYEVVLALAKHEFGVGRYQLQQAALRKAQRRGRFDRLIGMWGYRE